MTRSTTATERPAPPRTTVCVVSDTKSCSSREGMMSQSGRWCRAIAASMVLACAAAALPASAAETPGAAGVPALPPTLTRESVRELLSRLSDAQARSLLLEQLDRAAASPGAGKGSSMAGMAGVAGMVEANAGSIRGHARALYAALLALPSTLPLVAIQLADAAGESELWPLAGYLAVMLAIGAVAELAYAF